MEPEEILKQQLMLALVAERGAALTEVDKLRADTGLHFPRI